MQNHILLLPGLEICRDARVSEDLRALRTSGLSPENLDTAFPATPQRVHSADCDRTPRGRAYIAPASLHQNAQTARGPDHARVRSLPRGPRSAATRARSCG